MIVKLLETLEMLLSAIEFETLQNSSSVLTNEELFHYLIDKRILLIVNWSGEDEKYHISNFLQSRVFTILGKEISLDTDKAYEALNKKLDIGKGDHLPFLLDYFDKNLKKHGLTISLNNRGNDSYCISVSTIDNAKKLRKQKAEPWKFISLSARKTRVLYTIDCPDCGEMNVWELSIRDTPPQNECCDKCGKLLFDENGDPLVPYEKDYY